ncbi:tetratricopeptide repeat protein [Zymobacter palmae]|nr:SEL1-like repeat protein [Zymobacter palmae]
MNDQLKNFESEVQPNTEPDEKHLYLLALRYASKNEEYKNKSRIILEKLSKSGLSDAKRSLYIFRKELKIVDEKAEEYLLESAQDGNAIAQKEIAYLYSNKKDSLDNKTKYNFWMEKAANSGNTDAMREMAVNYFTGDGVKRDDSMGVLWLKRLYDKAGRHFDDWDLLGAVYETGRGTPIDLVKAYMCYDLEGTAGIEEKARIAPKMTAEQRAEGLRLSHEWQEKNHVYTMQSLGLSRQKDGSYR